MADLDRVKRNVSRLISANADEGDIDAYIASEGVSLDQVRAHKTGTAVVPAKTAERTAVDDWRKQNPKTAYVRDVARNVVRGLPFGSYLDEAAAGLNAYRRGTSYADEKRMIDSMDEAASEDTTTLGTLPLIGDVTTGGLTSLASGIATAPLAPVARIMQGATILPRAVNLGATGAGYGALYGSGEGNSLEERGSNALMGFGVGAGLGVAAPVVGAGVGNALTRYTSGNAVLPRELQRFDRAAIDRVRQAAEMDNLTPDHMADVSVRLGREGMMADASENLRTITEGLNQQPGPARNIITQAMTRRQEGAPYRIEQGVNEALGEPANLPATIRATEEHYRQAARPLYDQFYETEVARSPQLNRVISQIQRSAPGAFRKAQQLAVADGTNPRFLARLEADPMAPMTGGADRAVRGQRQWTPVELDYLKRAVDDIARNAPPGSNEARIYGGLARALRSTVDETISPGAAADSPWAQARQIAGDGIRVEEAVEAGRGAFNRNLSADQLEANMAGVSDMERQAMTLGAREALRSNMSNASTNFGPSGDRSARRLLNAPENRRKMEMLAETPQGAQRLTSRIEAENDMAETFNQVTSNSATARRQAARDIIPRQYDPATSKELRGTSLSGFAAEGVSRLANMLSGNYLNERNMRIAQQMAEMLVAQGVSRDNIARGILEMMNRQRLSAAQRNNINRFAESLLRGSAPVTIDAIAEPSRPVLRGSQMGQGIRE